jgi:DNA-directed RNA polymerase subunit RPC12/RpoP
MDNEYNEKGESVWKNTKCEDCGTNIGHIFLKPRPTSDKSYICLSCMTGKNKVSV